MSDHVGNRNRIINALREEMVGPSPQGKEIDCTVPIVFSNSTDAWHPWRQFGSGEEILQRDRPLKRYGVGVLYPLNTMSPDGGDLPELVDELQVDVDSNEQPMNSFPDTSEQNINDPISNDVPLTAEIDSDDFDLSNANKYKPSSMAISFVVDFQEGSELLVEASGGRYHQKTINVAGKERTWWLRIPVIVKAKYQHDEICANDTKHIPVLTFESINCEGLDLSIEVFTRPYAGENPRVRLLTVCLVNRKVGTGSIDELCLFQSYFKVTVTSPDQQRHIIPYPRINLDKPDAEEESIALLYRNTQTFAIGHGCSADWERLPFDHKVEWVSAESMPEIENPSITPDIVLKDGSKLEVSMAALAGLLPENDGFASLGNIISEYQGWIVKKQAKLPSLEAKYEAAAKRHLIECNRCVQRMQAGLTYLKNDPVALRAFRLANHAILLQQLNTRTHPRKLEIDAQTQKQSFSEEYKIPDPLKPVQGRGTWRPFQIAFILASLRSAVDGTSPDRRTVELIWFPTGGGKTEAYLGLAAFAVFMRRLSDPADMGVHVLMRYTLRLLTAQQFQRASALICAMEFLRQQSLGDLGTDPISIGIWVGGETTPNKREVARQKLRDLEKASDADALNPFILSRCPWCGAEMGRIKLKNARKGKHIPHVRGYEESLGTVVFKCTDVACKFHSGIPVYVIDEDIYEKRPCFVIGTVDKFAMLPWRPESRAIFGLEINGKRVSSPPGLIIQDELHLISGPLGSMVGLYEALIEELCTDRRQDHPVFPKIIASTATIRRYAAQIKALYAREDVALFPPQGLDVDDSFFARYARFPDGTLKPGRVYVGIHAPGLGSLQTTQVRSFTALLEAPVMMTFEERDPWWTLMIFFNSLRELGTTQSLFQSDIPDWEEVIRQRAGLNYSQVRGMRNLREIELTGRLSSDKVPAMIDELEISCNQRERPVDVCRSSSIIEVGIDINRLSLMAVVGQPKTTSQYIQVTGRVGRNWSERPGLIITLYSASKPRDRSHFEKFRSYHEQLYAQVEPTSVTPFSRAVLERALHAVMVSYVRQVGTEATVASPWPYPHEMIETLNNILLPRIMAVDPAEADSFRQVFKQKANEWQRWERTHWIASRSVNDIPLLFEAGAYVNPEWKQFTWPTPTSMRNVDATCQPKITRLYLDDAQNTDLKE